MTQALAVAVPHNALQVADADVTATATLLMKHKGVGIFPDTMTPQQAGQLARLACAYGLDPFASEIILYQGRPYLTIDGRMRVANTHKAFDGLECVPATEDERKAFRCRDDEHLWKATVWRRDRRVPTVAFGRASSGDGNPVSTKWAQEMAQKRAKHRALRDAFSIPLPGAEESIEDGGAAYVIDEGRPVPGVIEGEVTVVDLDATNPITAAQIASLHVLVGKLKWSDDDYRDMLRHTYDVESSKDLMEGQAASLLEMMHTLEEQQTGDAFIERIRAVVGGRTWADIMPSDMYESEPQQQTMPGVELPTTDERADYDRALKVAAALDLDVIEYVIDEQTTRDELLKLAARLASEIKQETALRAGTR